MHHDSIAYDIIRFDWYHFHMWKNSFFNKKGGATEPSNGIGYIERKIKMLGGILREILKKNSVKNTIQIHVYAFYKTKMRHILYGKISKRRASDQPCARKFVYFHVALREKK